MNITAARQVLRDPPVRGEVWPGRFGELAAGVRVGATAPHAWRVHLRRGIRVVHLWRHLATA